MLNRVITASTIAEKELRELLAIFLLFADPSSARSFELKVRSYKPLVT